MLDGHLNLWCRAEEELTPIAFSIDRTYNAGGYCYRENAGDVQMDEVRFSDEMTPRYDWTWRAIYGPLQR